MTDLNFRAIIKAHILENFADKEFTMKELYYSMFNSWNKPRFGKIFTGLKVFTQIGFLNYEMKKIGIRPRTKRPIIKAIYTLAKQEE